MSTILDIRNFYIDFQKSTIFKLDENTSNKNIFYNHNNENILKINFSVSNKKIIFSRIISHNGHKDLITRASIIKTGNKSARDVEWK